VGLNDADCQRAFLWGRDFKDKRVILSFLKFQFALVELQMPFGAVAGGGFNQHSRLAVILNDRGFGFGCLVLFQCPAIRGVPVCLPLTKIAIGQEIFAQRLRTGRPGFGQLFGGAVFGFEPAIVLILEDVGIDRWQVWQDFRRRPHKQTVFIGNLDNRNGRIVGIAIGAVGILAVQHSFGIIFLCCDQFRHENGNHLIHTLRRRRQAQAAAIFFADVQIQIRINPAFCQLVDEIIQPVQSLGIQSLAVFIPETSRPCCRIHVMAADSVNARTRQPFGYNFGIRVGWKIGRKAQVYAPETNRLRTAIKMTVFDMNPLLFGDGFVVQLDFGFGVCFSGNHKRHKGFCMTP